MPWGTTPDLPAVGGSHLNGVAPAGFSHSPSRNPPLSHSRATMMLICLRLGIAVRKPEDRLSQ